MASAVANIPRGTAGIVRSAVQAPQGTFLPGTKVQVGSHRVTIEKYLSEGGFAHVYVVRVPRDGGRHELAVLKRVAVPDKDNLGSMRTEVETMKKLRGHRHVVTYMDSHASQLQGGGYEVFLLMEYCAGGGLIDFMNTRLRHRLTEPEIIKIFADCAEGVAGLHYLRPPLLHRDLKVENVLIARTASGTPRYKICDFGSAAAPRPAPTTPDEGRRIEEDVQKHTTMQYRSPEMIDVWRKQPIDEKADIWALGVLLYKLCYYTTPFEDVGQMAILNASFHFPPKPHFSDRLKTFIGTMLKENPRDRPNIYQVLQEVCAMRGTEVPVKDIYTGRSHSEARGEQLQHAEPIVSVGLTKQAPPPSTVTLPEIAPMRRGRPTAASPKPTAPIQEAGPQGDPFAALDSKSLDVRVGTVDDLSKRFPSLDEFAITHNKPASFPFSPSPQPASETESSPHVQDQVARVLADRVFAQTQPPSTVPRPVAVTQDPPREPSMTDGKTRAMPQPSPGLPPPISAERAVNYKSTATGSSPPPSASDPKAPPISHRPIWKVPDRTRASSQPRASLTVQTVSASLQPSAPPSQRPALQNMHRSKSQTATLTTAPQPLASRPFKEASQSPVDREQLSLSPAASFPSRPRPSSAHVSSNLDFLREQEAARKHPLVDTRLRSRPPSQTHDPPNPDESDTADDMEYLCSGTVARARRFWLEKA